MGIIIGAMTIVEFGSAGGHASQVSWNVSPNIQRAYTLGGWDSYAPAEISSPTETFNITVYSPGPTYSAEPTRPTTGCESADTISARVSPAGCGAGSDGPSSTEWYVTSYNYSKGDARSPGTESWAMMQYIAGTGVVVPTYNMRGISEGSITSSETIGEAAPKAGIVVDTGSESTGTTGSVSAGQIGRSDYQYSCVVTEVGNSTAGSGDICQGSCSMPYTPLYV